MSSTASHRSLMRTAHLVDPLFVFAFLQRFVEILQDYLGDVSASSLKDNFDVVYQVNML